MKNNFTQKISNFFNSMTNKGITENSNPSYEGLKSFKEYFDIFKTYFYSWFESDSFNFKKYLKSYKSNPLVFMVVNRISKSTASIKLVAKDSKDKVLKNSKIIDIINSSPDLMLKVSEIYLLTGNVYLYYEESFGFIGKGSLKVLNTSQMEIVIYPNGDIKHYEYSGRGKKKYLPDEIIHIKSSNVVTCESGAHEYYGLSPLEAGWILVQSSNEKLNAEASIFKNRGVIGLLTSDTDTPLLKPEKEKLQKELDEEMRGSDKFNKIKISSTKLRYVQTGMSPTDLQLLEGILTSLRMICALYDMPSVLFNDNANSTYNNVAEAKKSAYLDVYIPLCEKILLEISKYLSNKLNIDEIVKPDLTSIELVKSMTNELSNKINSLNPNVSTRVVEVMTVNEFRTILDLPNIAEGDKLVADTKTSQKLPKN